MDVDAQRPEVLSAGVDAGSTVPAVPRAGCDKLLPGGICVRPPGHDGDHLPWSAAVEQARAASDVNGRIDLLGGVRIGWTCCADRDDEGWEAAVTGGVAVDREVLGHTMRLDWSDGGHDLWGFYPSGRYSLGYVWWRARRVVDSYATAPHAGRELVELYVVETTRGEVADHVRYGSGTGPTSWVPLVGGPEGSVSWGGLCTAPNCSRRRVPMVERVTLRDLVAGLTERVRRRRLPLTR
jgi:hypothetical protein